MANNNDSIGQRIKNARKAKSLSQNELAEQLNVSFQAVSAWESNKYVPDTYNLIELAKVLEVSVSSLVEIQNKYTFKTDKIFYNWQHMYTFVATKAKTLKLTNTLKALPYAKQAHINQHLKHAEDIPYISHPLNMACHIFAMNIEDDAIIAATLLHDVIEDCNKAIEDLPVDDEVKHLVSLLTHTKDYQDRTAMLKQYYKALATNKKAALIKLVDRCNNLTKMSWGLSRERIYRMISETEEYVLPLLNVIKNTEYDNAKWLLSYQIQTTLDIYKRLM